MKFTNKPLGKPDFNAKLAAFNDSDASCDDDDDDDDDEDEEEDTYHNLRLTAPTHEKLEEKEEEEVKITVKSKGPNKKKVKTAAEKESDKQKVLLRYGQTIISQVFQTDLHRDIRRLVKEGQTEEAVDVLQPVLANLIKKTKKTNAYDVFKAEQMKTTYKGQSVKECITAISKDWEAVKNDPEKRKEWDEKADVAPITKKRKLPSAKVLYNEQERKRMKLEHPDMSAEEINKQLRQQFKDLPEDELKKWRQLSAAV